MAIYWKEKCLIVVNSVVRWNWLDDLKARLIEVSSERGREQNEQTENYQTRRLH